MEDAEDDWLLDSLEKYVASLRSLLCWLAILLWVGSRGGVSMDDPGVFYWQMLFCSIVGVAIQIKG